MEEYCQVFSLHTDILPFKRRTKISFPFAFYAESLLLYQKNFTYYLIQTLKKYTLPYSLI